MWRAGAGLIVAALLALAGCKSADPRPEDKGPLGLGTARPKPKDGKDAKDAKGPPKGAGSWLDEVDKWPGAGTSVPKGTAPTNPKDPNFNPKTAAQDALGGRVLDSFGRPARDVFVRIEPVGEPAGPVPHGIYADANGYFHTNGLKPGVGYDVSVSVPAQDGKTYSAAVQTKVPNVTLALVLRDDLPPRPGAAGLPPTPRPSDAPPIGGFVPTQPKPPGEAWSPGGPTTGVPPATIGGRPPAPPAGGLPPPEGLVPSPAPAPPVKPENFADGPKDPFKPPPASIPGPGGAAPPVPRITPPPGPPGTGARPPAGTGVSRPVGQFALIDGLEREWTSDLVRPGEVVLVEFMTSACVPCKKAVPVLKDVQARYGASGLRVMGVLCDEGTVKERLARADRYASENGLNYTVYAEPGRAGSVRDRFDVNEYPHALLLDAGGRVLWRGNPLDRAGLDAALRQALAR